jgi:hypothetical protein
VCGPLNATDASQPLGHEAGCEPVGDLA